MCWLSALLRAASARARARAHTLNHAHRALIVTLHEKSKPSPAMYAKTLSKITRTKKKKHPAKYRSTKGKHATRGSYDERSLRRAKRVAKEEMFVVLERCKVNPVLPHLLTFSITWNLVATTVKTNVRIAPMRFPSTP